MPVSPHDPSAVTPRTRAGVVDFPEDLRWIQERVVNLASKAPCDVYVGRTFAGRVDAGWGNPHPVRGSSLRARIDAIAHWWSGTRADAAFADRCAPLAGQVLGCWCAPRLCHGHLLAGVAGGQWERVHSWISDLAAQAHYMPRRLLVTGSRHWTDQSAVESLLAQAVRSWGPDSRPVLVVGDAPGADAIAAQWWRAQGLEVDVHEADWSALGSKAGPVRNQAMVDSGIDAALAFPLGASRGTRGCIALVEKCGAPLRIVEGAR